ncbi:ESX secretion-associated protein EspG [Nocardia farcinica]|uniref:ESX secretion-associated protein EspG n=1 Tax=Nocardia farcinica TaxID=37329 RepID=UPI000BF3B242|nr:ESX secretion-associated protein EspG [Nocardia farcinica]MBF6231592.1 ESX secretion-associated protein EspG [Nocardia farcinica]MBF6263483.1 ESX secretion-associated protein EspG [Nocardia farcinica]MBF6282096.1 ESX secretion-associated protein EspG [Nocardia farcinica]MBF6291946.1 ESX secretion-associated protein EspG [Nocardia farcinica]MBF6306490.1 ESX secretion-associated protein EspG [Nocardia farcinica]
MHWIFTPDEFVHVWRETDVDRPPYPLRLLESPRTEQEAEVLRGRIAERFPPGADPDLTACLRILAHPHTRVVAVGTGAHQGEELRLLGCTVFDRAVLVRQDPPATPGAAGSVRVSIGHAGKLGARIASLLPKAPPGREPARAAPTAEVYDTEAVRPAPAVARIRRLLLAPHTGEGHIRIEPRLDRPQPPAPIHYTWFDVADDGRYLVKADDTVRVVPASAEQLAAQLQKRVPAQAG